MFIRMDGVVCAHKARRKSLDTAGRCTIRYGSMENVTYTND